MRTPATVTMRVIVPRGAERRHGVRVKGAQGVKEVERQRREPCGDPRLKSFELKGEPTDKRDELLTTLATVRSARAGGFWQWSGLHWLWSPRHRQGLESGCGGCGADKVGVRGGCGSPIYYIDGRETKVSLRNTSRATSCVRWLIMCKAPSTRWELLAVCLTHCRNSIQQDFGSVPHALVVREALCRRNIWRQAHGVFTRGFALWTRSCQAHCRSWTVGIASHNSLSLAKRSSIFCETYSSVPIGVPSTVMLPTSGPNSSTLSGMTPALFEALVFLANADASKSWRNLTGLGSHNRYMSSKNAHNCSPGSNDASSNAPWMPMENTSGISGSPCSSPSAWVTTCAPR